MSPDNINLIYWIKIDLVLLYMIMIDICFSAKYRRLERNSNPSSVMDMVVNNFYVVILRVLILYNSLLKLHVINYFSLS